MKISFQLGVIPRHYLHLRLDGEVKVLHADKPMEVTRDQVDQIGRQYEHAYVRGNDVIEQPRFVHKDDVKLLDLFKVEADPPLEPSREEREEIERQLERFRLAPATPDGGPPEN